MRQENTRGGIKKVSRWQKVVIETVLMYGGRQQAADHLEMPKRSLDDILYRAYIALDAKNFDDAVDKLGLKSKYGVKKDRGNNELSGDSA